jgi:predicted peptidase
MGGSGTWLIASRHPDLFAAVAPVFGGWDFRLLPGSGFANPGATTVPERFVQESQSSFVGAEGLLNLPLLVNHGDSDPTVTVEYSRHAVRMLQRWGYDVRYACVSCAAARPRRSPLSGPHGSITPRAWQRHGGSLTNCALERVSAVLWGHRATAWGG